MICSSVPLVYLASAATHISCSAAQSAAATTSASPAGKCGAHTSRHSASWSIVCQGVSVPPQSKITAATATVHILGGLLRM